VNRTLFLFLSALFFVAGCTSTVTVRFRRPAKLSIKGVKTVAVRPFEVPLNHGLQNPDAHIRQLVADGIREGGYYDLQDGGGDGIINGRVWWLWVEQNGEEPIVQTETKYSTPTKQDPIPRLIWSKDYVVGAPFTLYRGFLKVELTFIKLAGEREETVTTVTDARYLVQKVGGAAGGGGAPDRLTVFKNFAAQVTREFIERVSPYYETLELVLAGASGQATSLIKNGKYEEAAEILRNEAARAQGDAKAACYYDLGVCWEAIGGLDGLDEAIRHYQLAVEIDPADSYCEALGRATRLKRDVLKLRRQEIEQAGGET